LKITGHEQSTEWREGARFGPRGLPARHPVTLDVRQQNRSSLLDLMTTPQKAAKTKDPSLRPRQKRSTLKTIVNAVQIYDDEKLGFPIAEFQGKGQFQGITKGETIDGTCLPRINGHRKYFKIYRVTSIRHTIQEKSDGTILHLKSLFVENAL